MPRPTKLSDAEIQDRLRTLPGWTYEKGRLHRAYRFKDFVEAMGFMVQAALHAERLNHHPEWSNVYHGVMVDLVTHDADGVTILDFELAGRMETIAEPLLDAAKKR